MNVINALLLTVGVILGIFSLGATYDIMFRSWNWSAGDYLFTFALICITSPLSILLITHNI